MYTLEEYRDMVKKAYLKHFTSKLSSEAEEYFDSDEAQKEIKEQYNADIKKLKSGEISDNVFRHGSVSGTAYTLYLMQD